MPPYQLHLAPSFLATLGELTKRYPQAPKTVTPALETLKQRPEAGSAIPGWHRTVWKLRINSRDIRRGKRFGFRLIYYLVQLVKKEYPNSAKPAGNLPAKELAIAMRYWTLNCDEVYLEGTTIYPLLIYAKTNKADASDQEIMRALRAIGKAPEGR